MLGFQLFQHEESSKMLGEFPSAISRYLVSSQWESRNLRDADCIVSIRYIAVLGFQQRQEWSPWALPYMFPSAISRYLVSNLKSILRDIGGILFPSAISRYLVSNSRDGGSSPLRPILVSIRYIAVLGFQHVC